MNLELEKMIADFNSKTQQRQKNFNQYLKKIQNKSNYLIDYSKIKLEIAKCKFDLKKEYSLLGKYVVKKYIDEQTIDFTYDNKYNDLVESIKNLKIYILKLEENI